MTKIVDEEKFLSFLKSFEVFDESDDEDDSYPNPTAVLERFNVL